jgi:hypothetical protein
MLEATAILARLDAIMRELAERLKKKPRFRRPAVSTSPLQLAHYVKRNQTGGFFILELVCLPSAYRDMRALRAEVAAANGAGAEDADEKGCLYCRHPFRHYLLIYNDSFGFLLWYPCLSHPRFGAISCPAALSPAAAESPARLSNSKIPPWADRGGVSALGTRREATTKCAFL